MSDDFLYETDAVFTSNPLIAEAHHYVRMLPATVDLPANPTQAMMSQALGAAGGVLAKLYVRADEAFQEAFDTPLDDAPNGTAAAALRDYVRDLSMTTSAFDAPMDADHAPSLKRLITAEDELRMLVKRLDEEIQRKTLTSPPNGGGH